MTFAKKNMNAHTYKLIVIILSLSCQIYADEAADNSKWLEKAVKVVAITYDFTQEESDDAVVGQRPHKGLIVMSKALTKKQVDVLHRHITGDHPRAKQAKCFWPHHGFIFYDAEGKVVGHISLCLSCQTKSHSPREGLARYVDWKGLRALLVELKMPILKSKKKGYTELFKKNRS